MKTKNIITSLGAVAVIVALAGCASEGGEKDESISMDKIPATVKQSLSSYAKESEVKSADKGDQDGKQVYEFVIEQGAKKYELALSPEGKFMGTEEDMELSAMPEGAQNALKAQGAGGKISGREKAVDENNKVTYEADIEKDGKKFEVAVDTDGKVISTESASDKKTDQKPGLSSST